MFILTSGYGGLAFVIPIPLAVAGAFLAQYWPVSDAAKGTRTTIGFAVGLALSAVPVWYVGRHLNRRDRLTGERYGEMHSLYSLPFEYWACVWPVVAAAALIGWLSR